MSCNLGKRFSRLTFFLVHLLHNEVSVGASHWFIQGLIYMKNNLTYLMVAINLKP